MAQMLQLKVLILMFIIPCFANQTPINLRMYYAMEEELIMLSDMILTQEAVQHDGQDVHGLYNLSGTIENAKIIHRNMTLQAAEYVAHPINAFHLIKRLVKQWKPVVSKLLDTTTCVKSMKIKMQNIEDTIPSEKDFISTTYTIFINLEKYNNVKFDNLERNMKIFGVLPVSPVTAFDTFDIGHAFLENSDYGRAVTWLRYAEQKMKQTNSIPDGYSISAVLNKLATAHSKIGNLKEAIHTVDELLQMDPENRAAIRNKKYFQERLGSNAFSVPQGKKVSNRFRIYENICKSNHSQESFRKKNLKCLYLPTWKEIIVRKSNIKAEILHRRPLVVLFHGVTNDALNSALSSIIERQPIFLSWCWTYLLMLLIVLLKITLTVWLWHHLISQMCIWCTNIGVGKLFSKDNYLKAERSLIVQDNSQWKWIYRLQKEFLNYKISRFPASATTHLMATNVGIEGFVDETYKEKITVKIAGTTLLYLNDATLGGEVVFPKLDIKVPVKRGNVVFYEPEAWVSVCPVLYGSQWYATMDIYQDIPRNVCPHKRRTLSLQGLL